MPDDFGKPKELQELKAEYANNHFVETSIWDLKIFFGQWYQNPGVDWHTAVTLPWAQAKLLAYFLNINVAIYEHQHGRIDLPEQAWPKSPALADPSGKDLDLVSALEAMHKKFISEIKSGG